MNKIKRKIDTAAIERFYMSGIYPWVIAFIVLLGSLFGLEIYFAALHVALLFVGLAVSKSIKPFFISLFTYHMQLSVKNAPFYPKYSDYIFTGWRLVLFLIYAAAIASGIVLYSVKHKTYKKLFPKKLSMSVAIAILALAFMLNGVGSSKWTSASIPFALGTVAAYAVPFLFIYSAIRDEEKTDDLGSYLAYITMPVTSVISIQILSLYLSGDVIVSGEIVKTAISLGWGIQNLVGASLVVLIPVLFYGMHKNKYPWLYFAFATLAYLTAVMTMSRNALLVGTLVYGACVIISCFKGKNKAVFRIVALSLIAIAILVFIIFFDKFKLLLSDYFNKGLSDNGRFKLWRHALRNFAKYPIFGAGFYSLEGKSVQFGPMPVMAHNFILELLSATGIVGLLAYGYYLYKMAAAVLKKPSFVKTMLALSLLTLIVGSLLDNFVFYVYTMLYFGAILAVIIKDMEK